ncbi:MAG: hypothetical protein MUE53_02125 [Chitinophagales bacterium]|jgi:DNA-binding CsgD family transcriptional regulator|nr:hypothetical protein [Chitinophagales bacterium]
MIYIKNWFSAILILLILQKGNAQEIFNKGVPYIKSFKNQHDKIYSHTWAIDEAPNRLMYFVNDKGLLEFDGNLWKLYSGSKGITRSIKIIDNKHIYTGSDNDFGIWTWNEKNEFEYKSLYQKIQNKTIIEEFWNIGKIDDKIVFQSFGNLYIYEQESFTIIKAPKRFVTSRQGDNCFWIIDEKEGLMQYDGNQLKPINFSKDINYSQVIGIDILSTEIKLITKSQGFFSIKDNSVKPYGSINYFPKNDIVFSFQRINANYFALGTIQSGVLIFNNNAELIHKIDKVKGLQNNTVLSMYYSSSGYLWLGLDFGLDALNLNSSISYIVDYNGAIGTTYSALGKDKTLYLGTNQGLYQTSYTSLNNNHDKMQFQFVPNTQGQVWTMKHAFSYDLVGHDKGLYRLSGNSFIPIDDKKGVLTILEYQNYLLTGNYEGVHAYYVKDNKITYYKKIEKLVGTFKQLLSFQNKIFANLPNDGILEIELDSSLNLSRKILHSKKLFGNTTFVAEIKKDTIYIHTIDSVYSKAINSQSNHFKAKKYRRNIILKNNLLQDNFMPIYTNDSFRFYSIYNGFSIENLLSTHQSIYTKITAPLIRKVVSYDNLEKTNLINGGKVKFKMNNLLFHFILPSLEEDIEYQYALEPSQDWSSWKYNTSIEFLNLKEGKYTFKIRARYLDQVSEINSFEFTVRPPFYRSWWAYLFYLFVIFMSFYSMRLYGKRKLKLQRLDMLRIQKSSLEEQSRKYNEKLELERREKLELEQRQLQKTLENKELELAKKTIDQMDINDMILSIKKKIEDVQANATDKLSIQGYNDLIQFIDKKINHELAKEYEIAFDSSQAKFHEALLKAHPMLSSKDLRICSYVLMNLTSKEISKILNVLPSSIDVGRSRLRKKLNLNDQDNLREYLRQFVS